MKKREKPLKSKRTGRKAARGSASFNAASKTREPIAVFGRRPVEELLRRGIIPEAIWVDARKSSRRDPLTELCRSAGWEVIPKEHSSLDAAAEGLPHQGYVAFLREFPYLPWEEFLQMLQRKPDPFLLALDRLQDAGNLGAVIRSAECAGCAGALLPLHRAAGVTAAAIKRSAGAAFHLPICRVPNLSNALDRLIELDFTVYGADQEGSNSIYEADFTRPHALVIGSESRGLRPGIKRRCDMLVSIPLQGVVGSLNASVAAAVCLFEVVRQRRQTDGQNRTVT